MKLISRLLVEPVPANGCISLWEGCRPIEAMEVYLLETNEQDTSTAFLDKGDIVICRTSLERRQYGIDCASLDLDTGGYLYSKSSGELRVHPSVAGSVIEIFVLYWKRNFFDWLMQRLGCGALASH